MSIAKINFVQLIQSLMWEPIYLPWECEAFSNAAVPVAHTKNAFKNIQFSKTKAMNCEEDKYSETRFIDCKRD